MALAKSLVTGSVVLPTGAAANATELIFVLSGYDSQGDNVVLPATERVVLQPDGALPDGFGLWPNIGGLRDTHYTVTARWPDEDLNKRTIVREVQFGSVVIGGAASYALADLLVVRPPPGIAATVVLTQAEYNALAAPDDATLYLVVQP